MSDTLEALAGTMPDGQVAERLGLEVEAVKAWRRNRGVAAFHQEPPAVRAERPTEAPRRRIVRRRGGDTVDVVAEAPPPPASAEAVVPAPRRPARKSASDRLAPFLDRMGKVPDETIAAEVGVTRGLVGAYRRKHGIPAYEGYLFQTGHAPARAAPKAPKTPAGPKAGGGSKIDAFAHLVGVEPDAVVAAKAGVSRTAVTGWRRRHEITASQPRGRTPKAAPVAPARSAAKAAPVAPGPRLSPLDAFADQFGKVADADIAAQAGVSAWVVGDYRRRRGIPGWQGFRNQPRKAALSPVVELRAVEPRVLRAYIVIAMARGEQREFIAVGPDIAEACRPIDAALAARGDGPWVVSEVRFKCEALG
jgi:hypothetical protein